MANAIAMFLVMIAQVIVIVQLLISEFWGKARARVTQVELEPEEPEYEEEDEEETEDDDEDDEEVEEVDLEQYAEYERAQAVDHYGQPAYRGRPQYRVARVPHTLQPAAVRMMCRLPPERTRTEVFYQNPNFARGVPRNRRVGSGRRQDP